MVTVGELKYYLCEHCGNLIEMVQPSGVPIICCGEPMTELVPGTVDAAYEKHVPVIEVDGDTVTVRVGSVAHPMTPEHYITFVSIHTENGVQRKTLKPGDEPVAVFALAGDTLIAAYEYCNIHGLWKGEM